MEQILWNEDSAVIDLGRNKTKQNKRNLTGSNCQIIIVLFVFSILF